MKFPDNCDVKKRTAADYLQWKTVSSPPPSLCPVCLAIYKYQASFGSSLVFVVSDIVGM